MANLTNNKQRGALMPVGGVETRSQPCLGGVAHSIFSGSLVRSIAGESLGYFRAHQSGDTVAAGDIFGGIAIERQDVAATESNGDTHVTVAVNGSWAFAPGAITQADAGKLVYATDDDTITLTALNNLLIGTLDEVSDGMAWVNIKDHAGKAQA